MYLAGPGAAAPCSILLVVVLPSCARGASALVDALAPPWPVNSSTFGTTAFRVAKLVTEKLVEDIDVGRRVAGRGIEKTRAPETLRRIQGRAAIGIYVGHDASIALSVGGRIQCVLELERLFLVRYYLSESHNFGRDWLVALKRFRDDCECDAEGQQCPSSIDDGVLTYYPHTLMMKRLPALVEQVFGRVPNWHLAHHMDSHASLAFHASPFRSALVVSYDAWGNDGAFGAYVGAGLQLERVARLDLKLGSTYTYLAAFIPAVSGIPNRLFCRNVADNPEVKWFDAIVREHMYVRNAYAGKLMGYAGTAAPDRELGKWVRAFIEEHSWVGNSSRRVPRQILEAACGPEEGHRVLAATIQREFEVFVHAIVADLLRRSQAAGKVEGIAMAGGCALNVLVNQLVHDTLLAEAGGLPRGLFVPPAPGDGGHAVGALWTLAPPLAPQPLQYLGFRLWDRKVLDGEARKRGARSLATLGGVRYLAELFAGGPAWLEDPGRGADRPIIAIVRGRQEFGPRALGHRSLMAAPDSGGVRERMNRLKHRQWYRPVAPMIAEEALVQVFGRKVRSPYMSMAPKVLDEVRERYPALAHVDGTARHQSLAEADEPWLHALLLAVGELTGLAALINTSFNTRGQPVVNRVSHILEMLDTLPDLDYVLIEDWLFRAPARKRPEPAAPSYRVVAESAGTVASKGTVVS